MTTLAIFYPALSRYDKENGDVPFSGVPGRMFLHRTVDLYPDIKYTTYPHPIPLPPSASADLVLCLGAARAKEALNAADINPIRGYRKRIAHRPAIITYSHMDCWDFSSGEDEESEDGPEDEGKDIAVTKRSNYLFWALADFKKLLTPARPHAKRSTLIHPPISVIVDLLSRAPAGCAISIDIETRPQDNTLDCIGLAFVMADCTYDYVVPFYDYSNTLAYSPADITKFFRALYKALLRQDITWIGHNLAFDFAVLFHYYSLPFPRNIHDTMLFMHRDNPFIDKSLAHAISYYTDAEHCHKGNFVPNISPGHMRQLLSYNADDIYWTGEVYRRQCENTSVLAVAKQAFDSQYLCHMMAFTGICVDPHQLSTRADDIALHVAQLLRVIRLLTGEAQFNPASPPQLAAYFYDRLGYEPPAWTKSGAAATDKTSLLELQLKQYNPLIPIILEYKRLSKELSMLQFTPYEK